MLLLLASAWLCLRALANSAGVGIPCDAESTVLGSPTRTKPAEGEPYRAMWWTLPPAFAGTRYTLRTADTDLAEKDEDPSEYTPGEWTTLYLRCTLQDEQFTGLLMYAEDISGNKVGEWITAPRAPYHVAPSGCVTHVNADPKAYLSTFRFKAPVGTGPVTIKALVKYGLAFPAMEGAFFWPNSAHLTLQEANAPEPAEGTPQWFQGEVGQSCDEVCWDHSMVCDLGALNSTGADKSAFYALASKASGCMEPLLPGCGPAMPAFGSAGCFYHDPACTPVEYGDKWVQRDPCEGLAPHVNQQVYQGGECCVSDGFRFCARYYTTNTPAESDFGPWERQVECMPSGGYSPLPDFPEPAAPPAELAVTCGAKELSPQKGRRICACVHGDGTPPPKEEEETGEEQEEETGEEQGGEEQGGEEQGGEEQGEDSSKQGGEQEEEDKNSAASPPLGRMLSWLLPAGLLALSKPSSVRQTLAGWTILLMLVALPNPVAGHNWLTSPSRSNKGGFGQFNGHTSPPCPPRGSRVHTQVAAGQKFLVEWASGHGFGSFTYLVVLRAKDERFMKEHSFALLDDYLESAPEEAKTYLSDYKAYHVTNNGPSTAASLDQDVTASIERPSIFRQEPDPRFYTKTSTAIANDMRVQYDSDKYPWIISVHKFALNEDKPDEMDAAFMEIPEGYESGQYIVQYFWKGYYDCVDVNVIEVESTDVWGSEATGAGFDRVDHCVITPSLTNYAKKSECKILKPGDTVVECSELCLSQGGNAACDSVQVSPVTLDPAARFPGVFDNGASHLPDDCDVSQAGPDDLVCYTLRMGDAPEVGPPYKVVSDPEDPVFYSTCYLKKPAWQFDQECEACSPPAPSPDFVFGQYCIDCDDMHTYSNELPVPNWQMTTECSTCDVIESIPGNTTESLNNGVGGGSPSMTPALPGNGIGITHRVVAVVMPILLLFALVAIVFLRCDSLVETARGQMPKLLQPFKIGGFVFTLIAFVLSVAATSVPSWSTADRGLQYSLWEACAAGSCVEITDYTQGHGVGTLDTVRAFVVLAVVLSFGALGLHVYGYWQEALAQKILPGLCLVITALGFEAMCLWSAFAKDVLAAFEPSESPGPGQALITFVWMLTAISAYMSFARHLSIQAPSKENNTNPTSPPQQLGEEPTATEATA